MANGLVICGRCVSGRLCGVRRRRPHPARSCQSPLVLRGDDVTEQPVGLMIDPGGEVQGVGGDVERTSRESEPPQPGDGDRAAVGSQLAEELAGGGVEGVDPAVTEVPDQDVAAEDSEGRRRQRHGPRRVEPMPAGEPLQQGAARREDVDEAAARPGVVVVLGRVLFREGDVQVAADVVNPERGETGRDGGVGEAVDQVEVAIEDLDGAEAEVGGVQELAGRGAHQGQSLVYRAVVAGLVGDRGPVHGDDRAGGVDGGFQPAMTPSSVANKNRAGAETPFLDTVKPSGVGLNTVPSGVPTAPGPAEGGAGMVTTSCCLPGPGWGLPCPSYKVVTPVALSETQIGSPGPVEVPQELRRFGSVCRARPGTSETRLVCW